MKIKNAKKDLLEAKENRTFHLESFIDGLNKKYGDGTAFIASQAAGMIVKFLPTGCVRLDMGMGGGFPMGRMTELYGNESAGKSTLLLSTIANFQRRYEEGISAIIDLERTFDEAYARALGVDTTRLIIVNPDYGEQAADQLDEVMQQKTDLLVGVDSIAAMTPIKTVQDSAEAGQMGLHPLLINRCVARCNMRMKRNLMDASYPTTTAIFLNQQRETFTMFGSPETTPGGRAKNYFTSMRLKLHSSSSKANKIEVPMKINGISKSVLVGRVVSFSVIKNKTGGTPFEDGEYKYYIKAHDGHPAWTFDNEEALLEAGLFHDVIKLQGGQYTYKSLKAKSPRGFCDKLRDDGNAWQSLYDAVLVAVKQFNSSSTSTGIDEGVIEEEPEVEEVE